MESKNEDALRYLMVIVDKLSSGLGSRNKKLCVEKGFIMMLLLNLNQKYRRIIGPRFFVDSMTNNLLFLRIVIGKHKRAITAVPRVSSGPGDDSLQLLGVNRLQSVVCVCYATTTSKAHGQSFGEILGTTIRED